MAVDDDVLVGYAAIGPGADRDADSLTGELICLEVDPERMRLGHGSRLLYAAVDHARAAGFGTLEAWCPLADEARREFLRSAGFGPDTAYRDIAVSTLDDGTHSGRARGPTGHRDRESTTPATGHLNPARPPRSPDT